MVTDELTNEIARVLVETQAATVENRARALRPLIAREVAAQKERDAQVADEAAKGCMEWDDATDVATSIAAAIRSAG
jgi:hypothetical protein